MSAKEASARIKINKLLEQAGWRFFDDESWKANIQVETNVKISEMWDDFENISNGFIDYLLLDNNGYPICVLEAKSEDKEFFCTPNPCTGVSGWSHTVKPHFFPASFLPFSYCPQGFY